MRAERDLLGPPRDWSAHGVVGALVLPGGVVGLLPCVVVVVGAGVGVAVVGEFVRPGGVAVAVVGAVVGTTVGGGTGVTGGTVVGTVVGPEVGTPVGVVDGVCGVEVSLGPSPGVLGVFPVVGRTVSIAISAGGAVGRCLGLAASGSGMSGVSIRGPPRRLLTMSTR
ncbi:hypothetical protein EV651_111161 [Kribbella sp. VKM Ac-2571]|nr:hypothetical protein EV651_111161 [Kribbella sp. VKM Ac-2571]